jgi:phosphoribosylamine---glycine ligase
VNILVVGGGAREHAICDAISRSENVNLFSVMSNVNPGIEKLCKDFYLEKETNIDEVVKYAKQKAIDLVFIGPEAPLEKGLTNLLQKQNIKVCAPTKQAARIETDKEWMRNLLNKYNISGQLVYKSFTDSVKAKEFIEELSANVVIKPIGLTGGKGVKVAGDHFKGTKQAMEYVNKVITDKIGGSAKVLIEEKAIGEEFTLQAFTDGYHISPLPAVQDHKRLLADDQGPNTGGMGSYSYANGLLPFLSKQEYQKGVMILQQIVSALASEDCRYVGPIYGQFIVTADDVKIIEINARFGDPEAMNVLALLKTDFVEIAKHMINATLSDKEIIFDKKSTVCKYVVPEGYGIKSMVGEPIHINEQALKKTNALLFYASVNKKDGVIVTGSSRSLAVVGIDKDISKAEDICEKGLSYIKGDHLFMRHDIGTQDLILKRVKHMKKLRGI